MGFNVDEIFDDGKGISIFGKLAFGAVNVGVWDFVIEDFWPKHEQSANGEDFFFNSIGCFSESLTAGTSFDGGLGTSSSNEGGDGLKSFDKINTGSGDGNWNPKFGF